MKYRRQVKYFLTISMLAICCIPATNLIYAGLQGKSDLKEVVKNVSREQLFKTDLVEGFFNYVIYRTMNMTLIPNTVIAGKSGFLFLGNRHNKVLDKVTGRYRPSMEDVRKWGDKVKRLQDWYGSEGVKFVVVVAPNKHSIYREELPDRMKYSGKTITDDIVDMAREKGIVLLDLRNAIGLKKDGRLLYYKTDSHWNNLGASIAYTETISFLNDIYDMKLAKVSFEIGDKLRGGGDLARMLKIKELLDGHYENAYRYLMPDQTVCHGNIEKGSMKTEECTMKPDLAMHVGNQPQYMINSNAPNRRKVLFLCDSFGDTHSTLFNGTFETIWKINHHHISGQLLADFVSKNKPDIVIYQIVERMLYDEYIVRDIPEIPGGARRLQ